jgi:uncharacterized membrane protein
VAKLEGGGATARLRLLYEGANSVFKSYLISLVASIVFVAAVFAAGVSALTSIARGHASEAVTSSLSTFAGVSAIAFVLVLVAIYYLWRGFTSLKEYDFSKYSIGLTGLKLYFAGVILILLALIILIPAAAGALGAWAAVAGLAVIGALLDIIGAIMVAIALWRLGDEPGGGLIKAGVILWILGILLSFSRAGGVIVLVASILIMIGAKDVRDRTLEAMRTSTIGPSVPPSASI